MTIYKEELKNVLKDGQAIGKILLKIEKKCGEINELIEEINGINIMLVENVHDVLKEGEN